MRTRTPTRTSDAISKLAASLVAQPQLQFVEHRPRGDGVHFECYDTVARQVEEQGGRVQYGWAIWEWPHTLVEAEFHAVWESPEGALLDVSPRPDSAEGILFLPDPARTFAGRAIDNVRHPLRADPRVHEFIAMAEQQFAILNRGERAEQFGLISVPMEEIGPVRRRMAELTLEFHHFSPPGRNDACYCGSSRKYKKCCGRWY